jgi:hypothetical protein
VEVQQCTELTDTNGQELDHREGIQSELIGSDDANEN